MCAQVLNNEVLVADFKGQPLDVVKKQLSRVIHAEWTEKSEVSVLAQSADQKRAENEWHRKHFQGFIEVQLRSYDDVNTESSFTASDADRLAKMQSDQNPNRETSSTRRTQTRSLDPTRRFIARTVRKLKPTDFGIDYLKPDFTRFSNLSYIPLKRLNLNLDTEVAKFNEERSLLAQFRPNSQSLAQRVAGVEIVFMNFSSTYPALLFRILREDGEVIGTQAGFLVIRQLNPKLENFVKREKLQQALELLGALSSSEEEPNLGAKLKQLPAFGRLAAIMSNPKQDDPLGFINGLFWQDYAAHKDKPVLANLSEDEVNGVPTADNKWNSLGEERVDADGWVLGRPRDPLGNRTHRLDRQYVPSLWNQSFGPIETRSIEAQLESEYGYGVAYYLSSGPPLADFIITAPNSNILGALYAGLDRSQQARLLRGEKIPFQQLVSVGHDFKSAAAADLSFGFVSPKSKFLFPTMLKASLTKEIRFMIDDGVVRPYPVEMSGSAFWLNSEGKLDQENLAENRKKKVWAGEVRRLSLELQVGNSPFTYDLFDPVPMNGKPYTLDTLPPALKTRMEKAFVVGSREVLAPGGGLR